MSAGSQGRAAQINALTSMRFFLALGVVGGHFIGFYPNAFADWPTFFYRTAPYGVSWFFVLSGYIIAYNYPRLPTNRDRLQFLALRIARLWPVHLVTLIAAVLILGRGRPLYLLAHLTLTQTWWANPYIEGAYNFPSWSVSNEMYFYLVYAGLMLPIRWIRLPLVIVPIAVAVALASFHGCYVPGSTMDAFCNMYIVYFPPARLIEFLTGVALFHLNPRVPQIVGLVAAISVLCTIEPTLAWPEDSRFWYLALHQVYVAICGAALIISLTRDGWLSRALANRPLILGGEISYSMYMTHQLVLLVLLPRVKNFSLLFQFSAACGIVIAISLVLFCIVEKPARDNFKKWLRGRRRTSEQLAIPVEAPAIAVAPADGPIK